MAQCCILRVDVGLGLVAAQHAAFYQVTWAYGILAGIHYTHFSWHNVAFYGLMWHGLGGGLLGGLGVDWGAAPASWPAGANAAFYQLKWVHGILEGIRYTHFSQHNVAF